MKSIAVNKVKNTGTQYAINLKLNYKYTAVSSHILTRKISLFAYVLAFTCNVFVYLRLLKHVASISRLRAIYSFRTGSGEHSRLAKSLAKK